MMGIEERALEDSSALCTWRRMLTKCDESFSAASAERRGAQRLCGEWLDNVREGDVGRRGRAYDLQ